MRYQASWKYTRGIGPLCIAISVLLGVAGAALRSPLLISIGALPLAYLYLIGHRLWVYLDDTQIQYQGWLKARAVKWEHIVSIVRAMELPYPRDRYYSPSSYQVRTTAERFTINLLYFPPEFARAFLDMAKRHGVMRRRAV